MAANYGSIVSHAVTLSDNTAAAVAVPTVRTPALRMSISSPYKTGHSARTEPVCFIFRAGGSAVPVTAPTPPSTLISPCLPPQVAAVEVAQVPDGATEVVIESAEGGVVWVQFYEVAS